MNGMRERTMSYIRIHNWFVVYISGLYSFATITVGAQLLDCGQPLAYKNQRIDGGRVLDLPTGEANANISNANCMQMCCLIDECTALTFSGFLSSRVGQCLLYACGDESSENACLYVTDDRPEGVLSIALNNRRATTSTTTATMITQSVVNNNTNVDDVRAARSFGDLMRSCSTPVGVAIFVTVFCCAINLGLLISLIWRHRTSRGSYNARPPNGTPGSMQPIDSVSAASTSKTTGRNLHHSQRALHAYNNIALEA